MGKMMKFQWLFSIALCCVLATSPVFAAETEDKGKADEQKVEKEKKDPNVQKAPTEGASDRGPRNGQRGPGGFGQGRRDGRNFDPAEMRNRMQERMLQIAKDNLDVTEEEWAVIKPRLAKVMSLSDNNNGMANVMRSMIRRNLGGADAKKSTEPVQIATEELHEALEKEAPTNAEIKAKLAALRGAREKNRQTLITAQQELKDILTVKQEAMLVMAGFLE